MHVNDLRLRTFQYDVEIEEAKLISFIYHTPAILAESLIVQCNYQFVVSFGVKKTA